MKVAEWLGRFPGSILVLAPESTLEQAVERMLSEAGVHDIYVVSSGNVVLGHLSPWKLTALFLTEHHAGHTRRQIMDRIAVGTAEELMDAEFVFARPDEELDNVVCRFIEFDVQDIPVLDEQGGLAGAINLNAVLREMLKESDVIFSD